MKNNLGSRPGRHKSYPFCSFLCPCVSPSNGSLGLGPLVSNFSLRNLFMSSFPFWLVIVLRALHAVPGVSRRASHSEEIVN